MGADGMLTDHAQRSVLHRVKDGACCSLIASKFPKLIDQVDIDYLSPLHLAAGEGNVAVVKALLSKGADPTGTGENCFSWR
jgi:ankyrin repeat protein